MVFGWLLASTLTNRESCVVGHAAVQLIVWWSAHVFHWVLPCFVRVDTAHHTDFNVHMMESIKNTAVPRTVARGVRRSRSCALLAISSGACVALSLGLGTGWSHGDAHVLSVSLLVLCSSRATTACAGVLAAYVWVFTPMPMAHGIVRGCMLIVAALLGNAVLPSQWRLVQIAVSIVVLIPFSTTCGSLLAAVSPATVLYVAANTFKIGPAPVLAFAILLVVV